jgi:hypothetical protein
MKILFRAYFHQKNFLKKVGRKFIRVRIRNRIRSKIVRICNTVLKGKINQKYTWAIYTTLHHKKYGDLQKIIFSDNGVRIDDNIEFSAIFTNALTRVLAGDL